MLEQKTLKLPGLGDSITEVRDVNCGGNNFESFFSFANTTNSQFWILDWAYPIIFVPQGSIVEWTAAVGQAVKEGDVVAMVETDKVTVDIKAEMDGVIVEHFCEVYVETCSGLVWL